jgi:dipeptidase E
LQEKIRGLYYGGNVMGKIVAIGGVNPPSSLDLIDKKIIKLTNKKHPRILYVPTAGDDNLAYCEFYRGIYEGRFGCKMDVLFLINETPSENEIREKIFSSDIIYVGGGSVSKLLEIFEKFNVVNMLREAYNQGIVLAGISAGAICWGGKWFDSEYREDFNTMENSFDYIKEDCMGFLSLIICPHYNLKGYRENMELMVKEFRLSGIAIDNNCAVEFVDGSYRIIATDVGANAYKVFKNEDDVVNQVIAKDEEFRPVQELYINI